MNYNADIICSKYLNSLLKKRVNRASLNTYFSYCNLYKNLVVYVNKDINDKEYRELVIAVKNEWNNIKNNI